MDQFTKSPSKTAQGPAQIYKILNQNSLLDVHDSQSDVYAGVYDSMMLVVDSSFSAPDPPSVTELRKQFDLDRRPMSR